MHRRLGRHRRLSIRIRSCKHMYAETMQAKETIRSYVGIRRFRSLGRHRRLGSRLITDGQATPACYMTYSYTMHIVCI